MPAASASRLSLEDRESVEAALGPLRYVPLQIVDRCGCGHPRVVLGFHGPKAISKTVYWLACPHLLRAVSYLESTGAVPGIENRIHEDPTLQQAFARAQLLYRRLAYRIYRAELPQLDPGPYLRQVRGVGGVGDPLRVKCLHAHVAFTLATGRGPAGSMALTEMGFSRGVGGRWAARSGCV